MKAPSILILSILSTLTPQLSRAQGSLTPPAGPPVASMKTLDQVEARTPVNLTTCPGNATAVHVISTPGSYYLTGNVTTETLATGITISASNVTLDLNGFTLIRLTGAGGTAISVGGFKGIHIRNGSIAGGTTQTGGVFTTAGWSAGLLSAPSSGNIHVSDLTVRGVQTTGIQTSTGGVVERCQVDTCGGTGISAFFITDCVVRSASGDAITAGDGEEASVRNCFATSVGDGAGIHAPGADVHSSRGTAVNGRGIYAKNATGCTGTSKSQTGLLAVENVTNCTGESTSWWGLIASNASNSNGSSFSSVGMDVRNNADNCSGHSFESTDLDVGAAATNCRGISQGDGAGLEAATATNCIAQSAGGMGLVATHATNCTASTSQGTHAIKVTGTATSCRGHAIGDIAIEAAIAIGCSSSAGIIVSPQKHLGTP